MNEWSVVCVHSELLSLSLGSGRCFVSANANNLLKEIKSVRGFILHFISSKIKTHQLKTLTVKFYLSGPVVHIVNVYCLGSLCRSPHLSSSSEELCECQLISQESSSQNFHHLHYKAYLKYFKMID